MQSPLAAQSSLWFSHIFSKAHKCSRSEREQVSYTPQTCLTMMKKKRSQNHNMLWLSLICPDMFQWCSTHVRANGCQRLAKPILGYPGYNDVQCAGTGTSCFQCIRRKEKWDLPHRRHSVLIWHAHTCTFWVTHCVDVLHTCTHKTLPGIVHTHASRVVVCRYDWDVPKLSKTFEGSRSWWITQRKGSVQLGVDVKHRWLLPRFFVRVFSAFLHSWVICGVCFVQGPQRHWLRGSVGLAGWWGDCKLWNSVLFNIYLPSDLSWFKYMNYMHYVDSLHVHNYTSVTHSHWSSSGLCKWGRAS